MEDTKTTIDNLNKELDETKYLLQQNTEKVIERGNTLDDLDHKTASLNLSAVNFRKKSRNFKNKIWWKDKTPYIIVIIIIIIILIIIIVSSKK